MGRPGLMPRKPNDEALVTAPNKGTVPETTTFDSWAGLMPYKDANKQRAYQRAYNARRRAEWFEGKKCALCSSVDDLELHHPDRQQKVSHRLWSWTFTRREAELAKCIVLCRSCHKAASAAQRARTTRHGTYAEYVHGCRCDPCKAARREYQRALRVRKRLAAA